MSDKSNYYVPLDNQMKEDRTYIPISKDLKNKLKCLAPVSMKDYAFYDLIIKKGLTEYLLEDSRRSMFDKENQ